MAKASVPYMTAYGNITKVLERIRKAPTPERFTQDFLGTKLNLKGGGARPVIAFLKRTGFLGADGTPTSIYTRFRNESQGGAAAAEALRIGYAALYEVNEYVHEAKDSDLKGIVVQVTGAEPNSQMVRVVVHSFKALRAFASYNGDVAEGEAVEEDTNLLRNGAPSGGAVSGIRLGYTINLNLPATSDIAVFNAIFKSLREHLL